MRVRSSKILLHKEHTPTKEEIILTDVDYHDFGGTKQYLNYQKKIYKLIPSKREGIEFESQMPHI